MINTACTARHERSGLVMRAVDQSYAANAKRVIVVTGGPGSGKSVIALSLLGELSRRGRTVLHATGSSAFTQTLRRIAGARAPRVKGMFKYFNQFVEAERNGLDVLICDEAHRIRETSANRYTSASLRSGRPQIAELIDAARVPVFLLDEHQVVRPGEIGTVAEIQSAAAASGLDVELVELDAQFRCGGSRAYETWVLRLLGLQPGQPSVWEGDESFTLSTVDGPSVMEMRLRALLEPGIRGPNGGGLLLDLERSCGWGRPESRCADRRMAQALEQQETDVPRWCSWDPLLGQRRGGL